MIRYKKWLENRIICVWEQICLHETIIFSIIAINIKNLLRPMLSTVKERLQSTKCNATESVYFVEALFAGTSCPSS